MIQATRFGTRSHTPHALLAATVLAGVLFACGETPPANTGGTGATAPVVTPPATTASASAVPTATATTGATALPSATASATAAPPPMAGIRASQMAGDLQAAGVDLKKLPRDLGKLEPVKLRKVMNTFTKSLGVQCNKCHLDDFKAPTPMKKVAARMWSDFVVGLQTEDGSPLYCDSCHQGKPEYLAKGDKKALSGWMDANFVKKLKRADKKDHGCETCHGEPFDGDFLGKWKK